MLYLISGKVIHGKGYGKKLGFPTVNLHIENEEPLPPGIYAGFGTLENIEYRAGIVIDNKDKVEAHLIGFNGDAYGKEVTLKINNFLREYKTFEKEEELIAQIKKDINQC